MQPTILKRFGSTLALALFTFTSLSLSAQSRIPVEISELGPQVGDTVPAFSLSDQNGNLQTLESIMGPNGAMLLFHRSADW